jgi:acyl-coenzyme A thioesterase PaaI-like protein
LVATVADASAELALRAATGAPLVVSDLHVTFLGFGRAGPVRARAEILHASTEFGIARIEIVDAGAEERVMTLVSVNATRDLPA